MKTDIISIAINRSVDAKRFKHLVADFATCRELSNTQFVEQYDTLCCEAGETLEIGEVIFLYNQNVCRIREGQQIIVLDHDNIFEDADPRQIFNKLVKLNLIKLDDQKVAIVKGE